MRVELTNGRHAVIKDVDDIDNATRLRAQLAYDEGAGGRFSKDFACFNSLLVDIVTEWSLDLPLPSVDSSSLDKLSLKDSNKLYSSMRDVIANLFPDFRPSTDPDSPTSPSAD